MRTPEQGTLGRPKEERSKEEQGRWEGDIRDTRRDWLRWALKFTQTRLLEVGPRRCLELAVFARVYQGIGPRRRESDSERQFRKAGGRLAELKSQRVKAEDDRDATRAAAVTQAIEAAENAIWGLRAAQRATVEQPSEAEARETNQELRELLTQLMRLKKQGNAHQEIGYQVGRRAIRWYPNVAQHIRYRVSDTETGSPAKELVVGGRFGIVDLHGWKDLAIAHFCELVARFGHELRECKGRGKSHIRWFLPTRNGQRACSPLCAGRARLNRFRQRKKAMADTARS